MNQYMGITVPSTTPGSQREYTRLEKLYLDHVDSLGVNPAELDLAIWKIYANRDDTEYKRLTNSSTSKLAIV
jgi:thermostable 8-oxoguanine DNA glycosylase